MTGAAASSPHRLPAATFLCTCLKEQGAWEECEALCRQVYAAYCEAGGGECSASDSGALTAQHNLGAALLALGQPAEAQVLLRRAFEGKLAAKGPEHRKTTEYAYVLAKARSACEGGVEEAIELFDFALAGMRKGVGAKDPAKLLSPLAHLARLLGAQGSLVRAEKVLNETMALREVLHGAGHPKALAARAALAQAVGEAGRSAEAVALWRECEVGLSAALGEEAEETQRAVGAVGALLQACGRHREAEPYVRRTLAAHARSLGEAHDTTLSARLNLGTVLKNAGDWEAAEGIYSSVLDAMGAREQGRGRGRGRADSNEGAAAASTLLRLTALNNLAMLQQARGRHSEAEALLRDVCALAKGALGDLHESTLKALYNLAECLAAQGRGEEAEAYYAEEREGSRARNPDLHAAQARLGRALAGQGKHAAAEGVLRGVLEGRRAALGSKHIKTLGSALALGKLLRDMGAAATASGAGSSAAALTGEAEALMKEAHAGLCAALGPGHEAAVSAASALTGFYRAQGRWGDAEPLYRQALELSAAERGEGSGETLAAMYVLACGLREQGRLEEAEALFRRELAACTAVHGAGHGSTITSMNNLLALLVEAGEGRVDAACEMFEALAAAHAAAGGGEGMGGGEGAQGAASLPSPPNAQLLALRNNHAAFLRDCGRLEASSAVFEGVLTVLRQRAAAAAAAAAATTATTTTPATAAPAPTPAPELGSGTSAFHPVAPPLAAPPPPPSAAEAAAAAELLALAYTLTGYARTLHGLAQHERAGALFQEALHVRCRELGEGHHLTLDTRHYYALLLRDMGSLGAARDMLQDTVARRRALLGEGHPDTLKSQRALEDCEHRL